MEKIFSDAAKSHSDALSQAIEHAIPDARITNHGWLVIVRLPANSFFTLCPLTDTTMDLSGTDYKDRNHEMQGVSWDSVLKFLKTVESGAQSIRESEPFGRDPLGAKERSEGRSLREGNGKYGSELFRYLKDVLPLADVESFVDFAGDFIVSIEQLRVRVIPKGANLYDVETFIGDKREPQQVQLSHAETLRYVFDLVTAVERVNKPSASGAEESEEADNADAYEVLRELAGELGQPEDILRNKDLVDLRAGLVQERRERTSATNELISGLDGHLRRLEALKHSSRACSPPDATLRVKWFRGHPVAVGGGMDGKTLRYVQGVGAVIVDKSDVPPPDSLKLTWHDTKGAVMVPLTEATTRPSWKPLPRSFAS